jgi:hypothetical protein
MLWLLQLTLSAVNELAVAADVLAGSQDRVAQRYYSQAVSRPPGQYMHGHTAWSHSVIMTCNSHQMDYLGDAYMSVEHGQMMFPCYSTPCEQGAAA